MKNQGHHTVRLRQLLSMIHNVWKHYSAHDWQVLGQKALWIATLAGAENSGVSIEAIGQTHSVLWMAWNQEVSIEEATEQLDAILKGE